MTFARAKVKGLSSMRSLWHPWRRMLLFPVRVQLSKHDIIFVGKKMGALQDSEKGILSEMYWGSGIGFSRRRLRTRAIPTVFVGASSNGPVIVL